MKSGHTNSGLGTWLVPLVLVALLTGRLSAAHQSEGFDSPQPSWKVGFDQTQVRLQNHRRHEEIKVDGAASESLVFEALEHGSVVQFEHAIGPARVIDELQLGLWVRSNRPGPILWLRAVLPHQIDPTSGQPAVVYFEGGRYTETGGQWQQLVCTTTDKQKQAILQLLRSRIRQTNIEFRDMYVDRAIVTAQLDLGAVEFFFDELRFGPIIAPTEGTGIEQVAATTAEPQPFVEYRLNRLLVEGQPFFPCMAPYHGEDLNALQQTGLNVIWVPDHTDTRLLGELRTRGMWPTATPPRPVSNQGTVLHASDAGFLPFPDDTAPILFWNLGARYPGESYELLRSWADQIRAADRKYRRPIVVDVVGEERIISREIPMLAVSRHALNTSFSPRRQRDWLIERRRLTVGGSFPWTWIQTEPATANDQWRDATHRMRIVVEPEQIFQQANIALAAGYRGVGFWNKSSLLSEAEGAAERRLAMTLLIHQLRLLEPWLATSVEVEQVPFQVASATTPGQSRGKRDKKSAPPTRENPNLWAAVIRTDGSSLLLPICYADHAQFVPAPMVADDLTIVVPGGETDLAWEVTTTGIHSLQRERGPGGIHIEVDEFDFASMILLTSDPEAKPALERKIATIAQHCARCWIDLAKAKRDRVGRINAEIQDLGVDSRDTSQILAATDRYVNQAEEAYTAGAYDQVRKQSCEALKLLRFLQYRHWDFAVQKLSSPVSSPYTVSFQTLPDHWRMLQRLGRSRAKIDDNLLRSGDFEDEDTMRVERWQHAQSQVEGVRAGAELVPAGHQGKYCLRLWAAAEPGRELAGTLDESPVTVTTPALPVRNGQIVHVSGWVQVVAPIGAKLDGAMLYDDLMGPVGALRWHDRSDWQHFELIREVPESRDLRLKFVLTGLGDVRFDDLRVIPHTPQTQQQSDINLISGEEPADEAPNNPFRFFEKLPKMNPLQRK